MCILHMHITAELRGYWLSVIKKNKYGEQILHSVITAAMDKYALIFQWYDQFAVLVRI